MIPSTPSDATRSIVAFSLPRGPLADLATGEQIPCSTGRQRCWHVALAPYELRSFTCAPESAPTAFVVRPPADVAASLTEGGEEALRLIDRARADGHAIPGMDEMARDIRRAISEGRLAWLRRALGSYVVRRARELAGVRNGSP